MYLSWLFLQIPTCQKTPQFDHRPCQEGKETLPDSDAFRGEFTLGPDTVHEVVDENSQSRDVE